VVFLLVRKWIYPTNICQRGCHNVYVTHNLNFTDYLQHASMSRYDEYFNTFISARCEVADNELSEVGV
jgi:hypothetical protein